MRLVQDYNIISIHLNSLRFLKTAKKIIFKEFNNKNKRKKFNSSNNNNNLKKEKFKTLFIKKINFRYDKSKKIIDNLNLSIKNKDKILFVGPSGSGKSTLINLLLGLLKPTSGKILFNKKDILKNLDIFHSKIGYVPQDIYLLDDTIKKNITFSDAGYDKRLLKKSIEKTRLSLDIKKFIKGVNTKIGHRGRKLSGGQKQRLALASALYRNPEILIMDEPTSSIDEKSEIKILNEFLNVSKNLTVIMVAHRAKKFENKFNKVIKLK